MQITIEQLRTIMPHAQSRAQVFLKPLNDAMAEFEINTPARQGAFLAQVAHESGSLRYVVEIASGEAYTGRKSLGNARPEAIAIAAKHGKSTGEMWKGRGLIQITGFDNNRACSLALFNDPLHLLHSPELLEIPHYAAASAGWFWKSKGLNELADAGDFRRITKRINGGYNGLNDRLAYLDLAKVALT